MTVVPISSIFRVSKLGTLAWNWLILYRMRTFRLKNDRRITALKAVFYLFLGILLPSAASAQLLNLPPVVVGPLGTTVSKGSSVTLSVTVVSTSLVNYQWFFGNTPIPGATSSSLTLDNVSAQNAGNYYVGVTNSGGGGLNGPATVSVYDSPPTAGNDSYNAMRNTTLTVAAPGVLSNDSYTYRGPLTAVLVSNVSHGTLNLNSNGSFTYLPATNYYGNDSFTYMANDGMSNSTPATVSLTVLAAPAITAQPQNQAIVTGQTATFSVTANGTAQLVYQWYLQGSLLNGATNSTLTVSNVANKNAGNYSVIVTNAFGSLTSTSAALTIIYSPSVGIQNASTITTNSAILNASVTPNGGDTGYYFQYGLTTNYTAVTRTNTQPAGTDDNVGIKVTGLSPGTVYHYSLVANNAAGTVTSQDATFQTAFLAPKVLGLDVTNVTAGSATFRAGVNPEGAAVNYYFRFGTNTDLSQRTATNSLPPGNNGTVVSIPVAGLKAGTPYYYSFVAVGSGGTSTGGNAAFATLTVPAVQVNGTMIIGAGAGQKYMQLSVSTVSGANLTVLGTGDLTLPQASWTALGTMTETSAGRYQFNDLQSRTNATWFYCVKSQ